MKTTFIGMVFSSRYYLSILQISADNLTSPFILFRCIFFGSGAPVYYLLKVQQRGSQTVNCLVIRDSVSDIVRRQASDINIFKTPNYRRLSTKKIHVFSDSVVQYFRQCRETKNSTLQTNSFT